MSLIELKGVHKSFGPQQVLRGVDISIEKGQTVVIIGGSGTGKSVTLKLIIGLLRPDQGEVIFDGRNWRSFDQASADHERTRFGYVFQGGALFDSLNILENVAFPLREHTRKKEDEIRDIVERCLLAVGLTNVSHKFPSQLSGGMLKRVSLSRALSMNPDVLLYDEPTTGLDPINSQKINELIAKTRDERPVTSIVVTHDMQSAFYLADRIVMLFKGRMIFQGTPDELKASSNPEVRNFVAPAFRDGIASGA